MLTGPYIFSKSRAEKQQNVPLVQKSEAEFRQWGYERLGPAGCKYPAWFKPAITKAVEEKKPNGKEETKPPKR